MFYGSASALIDMREQVTSFFYNFVLLPLRTILVSSYFSNKSLRIFCSIEQMQCIHAMMDNNTIIYWVSILKDTIFNVSYKSITYDCFIAINVSHVAYAEFKITLFWDQVIYM